MCLACEQGELEARWEMINVISTGKLPDGHSADDLRAMGLPLPGELYRDPQPDGSYIIRQRSPAEIAALKLKNFECDSPQ